MHASRLKTALLLLVVIALGPAGCGDDDDPTSPSASPWQEVELALGAGDSRLAAVDFGGDHGVAMAQIMAPGEEFQHDFFERLPDGSWLPHGGWHPDDPGVIPEGAFGMDLAVDSAGGLVLACGQSPGPPSLVIDLRGRRPAYIEQGTYGMLAVAGDGAFMLAGGRARGGGLWSSADVGVWSFDDLPLTGTNDSGFRDIDIRDGIAVACGYDDGADTLQVILTRTAGTPWRRIATGGPLTATYLSIARADDGTIFVGGMVGAGGMAPRAFLSRRTPDGVWNEVDLPDPERLHGVMDILIAEDETIYLACMGEGDETEANLVHLGPSGAKKEITPFPGGMLQVDQAADGEIVAVGFRRDGDAGTTAGVMLLRSP